MMLLLLFCCSMSIRWLCCDKSSLSGWTLYPIKITKPYSALDHEFNVFGHSGAETSCLIGTSAGKHVIFINNGSFHMLNTHTANSPASFCNFQHSAQTICSSFTITVQHTHKKGADFARINSWCLYFMPYEHFFRPGRVFVWYYIFFC